MARLNAQNRQEQIIELLNNNGSMKATELADYFSVSRETIRRDLNTLSENGSSKKGFGGAIAVHDFTTLPIDSRLLDEHDAKKRIARKNLIFIITNFNNSYSFWLKNINFPLLSFPRNTGNTADHQHGEQSDHCS